MFSDGELTGFFGVGNFTIRYYLGRNGENFVLKRQKFKAKQSES